MQKSAVAVPPAARSTRRPADAQLLDNKGQKFEPFSALGNERRSTEWLQKTDRKR